MSISKKKCIGEEVNDEWKERKLKSHDHPERYSKVLPISRSHDRRRIVSIKELSNGLEVSAFSSSSHNREDEGVAKYSRAALDSTGNCSS
mmetsp:Transcript_10215/g.20607  ORF Transcript_10215/g.20607 Transcript_10215/m.20607 type:complete len:90 (-) Transcript_10215:1795-2064(-)